MTPLQLGSVEVLDLLMRGERIVSPVVVVRRGARQRRPWGIADKARSVHSHSVAALVRRGVATVVDTDQGKELRLR